MTQPPSPSTPAPETSPQPQASVPLPPSSSAVIDLLLRVAMVAALIYACYRIMLPFASIGLWSVILAVMFHPLHKWLRHQKFMGNRRSAALIATLGAAVLLVPLSIAAESMAHSAYVLVEHARKGTLELPPLPPRIAAMPLLGPKIAAAWTTMAANLPAAVEQFGPQIKEIGMQLGKMLGEVAGGTLSFVGAIIIAGIILAYGESGAAVAERIFVRATADNARGARLARLATATTRGVATGVIGVAFIQAVLVGIGLFVAGIPAAGALSLAALLLGVIQVPVLLVTAIPIIYIWGTQSATYATIFTIAMVVAGTSDAVLKPLLLGRGLEVPMPVILLGVIGGTLSGGLVGLFTGPILLSVGYVLFMDWLGRETQMTRN